MKHVLYPVLALFLLHTAGFSQASRKGYFAQRALIGTHFGVDNDYVGQIGNQTERATFWGMRAGVSITRRLYGGIQSRLIWAGNFETPTQQFYMAGVWTRFYFFHPYLREQTGRWGLFLESGLLTGNYFYENKDFIEYPVQRPGQWYIPAITGAEFRFWRNLGIEAGVQLYLTAGENWDTHGIAYPSIGLNWYPGL